MKKHRGAAKQKSGIVLMLYELIFSGALLIALSMLSAFILSYMGNPTASIKIFSLVCLLLCAAISGFFISRRNHSMLSSIAVSAVFTVIMLAVSLIAAKGAVGGGVLMNYLCYMLIASFSAFLGRKKEHRRRR